MRFKALAAAGLLIVCGALVDSSAVASAQEVYTATLVSPRGIRADKTAKLTLTIEQYSTAEDALRLQKILAEQGSEGLIKALREMNRGVAKIEGGTARRINHVRVHEAEGGNRIIIVTEGPLHFPEDTPDPRSRDSLGFIRLDLNKAGQGGGTLAEAVDISITEDGVLQIQAYQTAPIQLRDARRER